MSADLGREAVYAAEIAAFEGTAHESPARLDELVALAGVATSATWWPHGPIRIVAARSDAASSSTRQAAGASPVIRLAAPQMTPATVVHELAHVLAGVSAGHGDRFRRAHVDLAGYLLGDEPAEWLIEAYAALQLGLGDRSWDAPPIHRQAGGPIAL